MSDDLLVSDPDRMVPASAAAVARLSAPDREQRVLSLIRQSRSILEDAVDTCLGGRRLVGQVVLFSGGNDSTVLLHLMRAIEAVTHTAHANTTVGVEQTRQFVRDVSARYGIPLIEKLPPKSYRELVLEEVNGKPRGFPGPGAHYFYYQRLKERGLRQVRRELVTRPRSERVLFIAGRRRSESTRRSGFRASGAAQVPLFETEGSIIWVSPLALWTKLDMNTYRLMAQRDGDPVPVNEVSDLLHMSGECLCGCFAKEDELEEVRQWFPDTAADIDALRAELAATGFQHPQRSGWGHGKGKPTKRKGMLCEDCDPPEGQLFGMADR